MMSVECGVGDIISLIAGGYVNGGAAHEQNSNGVRFSAPLTGGIETH